MLAVLPGVICGTNEFGKKFLEENKKKEGVVTLPSGLQYKVLHEGHFSDHPHENTTCDVHFQGWLASNFPNGPKFSSTTFGSHGVHDHKLDGMTKSFAPNHKFIQAPQPNHVIPAMKEALLLMVEGAKWELYVPSELGYGDEGSECDENRKEHKDTNVKEENKKCKHNQIDGGEALVFQIELDKIKGRKEPANVCDVENSHECKEREKNYVDKMKALGPDKIEAELKRLQSMMLDAAHLKPEKHGWLEIRIKLLQKMSKQKSEL